MTYVLIANGVLAAVVLAVVGSVVAWAVRGSHHEGRPVVAGSQRRWQRHTISLRPRSAHQSRTSVRPFA
jgi:hypothetical protein